MSKNLSFQLFTFGQISIVNPSYHDLSKFLSKIFTLLMVSWHSGHASPNKVPYSQSKMHQYNRLRRLMTCSWYGWSIFMSQWIRPNFLVSFLFSFYFFVLMTHFESSKWNSTYFLKLKQSIVHMLSSWLSTLATCHPCSPYSHSLLSIFFTSCD